jgi:chromosome segregation ATPase
MYNAQMVADYLTELCKDLKRMRDEKYYTELGYDFFDDYVEKDVGIKKRQAYTYISTYERLGDTFLQSNAKLGITKLSLLTEVPAVDRPDFADDNDLEKLSTREIKELIEKSKQKGEQLSLLTNERDEAKTRADDAAKEADKARKTQEAADRARLEADRRLKEAQERAAALEQENEKLKNAEPDAAALEKIKEEARKEAEKKAKKDFNDKLQAEKDKAAADALKQAEEKINAARKEGEKAAEQRIKNSLEAVEREKSDALTKATELEKKLKVASNQDTALFNFLYDAWQQDFNKICGLVKKVNETDSEFAGKMKNAINAVLSQQQKILND